MTTFHSGKQGKVTCSGTDVPVVRWSGAFRAERIEVTNALSGGFAEFIAGVLQGRVRFTALWDSDTLPNDSPGLVEGASVACTLHCAASGKTFAGTLFVESVDYNSSVRGPAFHFQVTGLFSGSYTRPSA